MDARVLRKLELLDTESRKRRVQGQKSGGVDASINITPLVDVVLVLLIIFMVVTPMLDDGIALPESANPQKLAALRDDLRLSIKKSGEISIDKELVSKDELTERLRKEMAKSPYRVVYLSADKDLQFVSIRDVLKSLREVGVGEAGLLSSASEEET